MQNAFDFYPETPGWKRRDTSKQAAEEVKPSAETLRNLVYQVLKTKELSADEVAAELEIDKLSIRPRLSELSKMDKIEDSGKRTLNSSGKKAIVWRVK